MNDNGMNTPNPESNPESKGRAVVWGLIILILAIGIAVAAMNRSGDHENMSDEEHQTQNNNQTSNNNDSNPVTHTTEGQAVTVNVSGRPFSFTPNEIKVKTGDKVKIVFKNEQGNHDWVVDEFNARTPVIKSGETAEVEFVADKTGSFEFYCSVGNHREMGMKGTLIVE